jgi:hypothetical protein
VQASHTSHTESLRSERERRNERMKAQQAAAVSLRFRFRCKFVAVVVSQFPRE